MIERTVHGLDDPNSIVYDKTLSEKTRERKYKRWLESVYEWVTKDEWVFGIIANLTGTREVEIREIIREKSWNRILEVEDGGHPFRNVYPRPPKKRRDQGLPVQNMWNEV